MAARYWVPGGNGNWSSTGNWSASSGGASGATTPTAVDDAYFDVNSFTAANRQVKIDAAATARNLDFTGAINSPWFTWTSSFDLTLHGDLTIPAGTTVKFGAASLVNNSLIFAATSGIQYIDTNSNVIPAQIEKTGSSQLQLLSNLRTKAPILIGTSGTNDFDSNNFNITININASVTTVFSIGSGTTSGTFNFGTSTLEILTNQNVTMFSIAAGCTASLSESTINARSTSATSSNYVLGSYTYGTIIARNVGSLSTMTGDFTADTVTLEVTSSSVSGFITGSVNIENLNLVRATAGFGEFSGNNVYIGTATCYPNNELKFYGTNSYVGHLILGASSEIDYSSTSGQHWIDNITVNALSTGTRAILRGADGVEIKSNKQVFEMDYVNFINFFPHKYTVWYAGANSTYNAQLSDTTVMTAKPTYNNEKQIAYRVFTSLGGDVLGELENVISEFSNSNEINTSGGVVNLTVQEAISTATSNTFYEINNHIEVFIRDRECPLGQIIFQGYITDVAYNYDDDTVNLTISSYGQELQKNLIQSSDVSFASETTSANVGNLSVSGLFAGYENAYAVDSFTTGGGTTNVHSISLDLSSILANYAGRARIKLFSTRTDAENTTLDNSLGTTAYRTIYNTSKQTIKFIFPSSITVSSSTEYFYRLEFTFLEGQTNSPTIYLYGDQSAGANQGYTYKTGGASSFVYPSNTAYLAFVAYSNDEQTEVTFNSTEIADILRTILNNYQDYGGNVIYSADSIQDTGVTITYTFNTDSISAGIESLRRAAPDGWHWYVDPRNNLLTFKEERSIDTVDHFLPKGDAIANLKLSKKGGDIINTVYFTGGDTGGGVNLYKKYVDTNSFNTYGRRAEVRSDGRVTVAATAQAMSEAILDRFSQPFFVIDAVILDNSKGVTTTGYDIESLRLGQNVMFTDYDDASLWDGGIYDVDQWGEGINSVANQVLQIVRVDYKLGNVSLVLNIPNTSIFRDIRDLTREANILTTADNPAAPT